MTRSSSWIAVLLALAAAPCASAQLQQGERDRAMSHLHATRKAFLDAIAGLTAAQWNFKPATDAWSVAECAGHIALSEDFIFDRIVGTTLKTPPQPEKKPQAAGRDEEVLRIIADRSERFQAPQPLLPSKRWATPAALAGHFKQSRARTIRYIQTTQADLRSHFSPHPVAKLLDAYQWFLLIAAHTGRHTAQIAEITAHPSFPK